LEVVDLVPCIARAIVMATPRGDRLRAAQRRAARS